MTDPRLKVHKAFMIGWCEKMAKDLKQLRNMVEDI